MRRSAYAAILSIAVLLLTVIAPAAASANSAPNTTKEVKDLIETYGPLLVLHPQEQFVLDKPEAVLDGPSTLNWGLVYDENNPSTFHVIQLGSTETSSQTIRSDEALAMQDPNAGDSNFRIWLETNSSLWDGHPARAKSYIMVSNPGGDQNTMDIQYWFNYAYNGPAKISVTIPLVGFSQSVSLQNVGRHQGDWEQVILRFTRTDSDTAWSLEKLFLSQHSGGQWIAANDPTLTYDGTHPVIYSALDSHANYATLGVHTSAAPILSVPIQPGVNAYIYQLDYTASGETFASFRSGNFDIVSSTVPGVKAQTSPQWFDYNGLWGPYDLNADNVSVTVPGIGGLVYPYAQVDKGPVGPAQHASIP